MRLANEVLRNNRLLFVRQPTQASSVLFHVYSRTLESLVEPVGDSNNSQLDLLLIRALRRIMLETGVASEKDREIFAALCSSHQGLSIGTLFVRPPQVYSLQGLRLHMTHRWLPPLTLTTAA